MKSNYYKSEDSVREYIKMAADVSGEQLIRHLQKFLATGSLLLEIGTGPGTDWNILNKHYSITGSDYSDEFLNYLLDKFPKGDFLKLDARTLETENKFDGLYSNKVFQHLNDTELADSIERQREILNSQGHICHSFWKGEGTDTFNGLFVNYQSEISLRKLFEKYFNILLLTEYKEFEDGDSLLLIGQKK